MNKQSREIDDVLDYTIDLFVGEFVVDDSYKSLVVGVDLDISDIKEYCLLEGQSNDQSFCH
ncbi:unnamed protein product [Brassica rapa subsp. trilocularis]